MGNLSPTETVISRVAQAEGVDSLELPPLQESIDADALDSLVSGPVTDDDPGALAITFRYCGYTVSVSSGGAVEVVPE